MVDESIPDAELLQAHVAGDPTAFATLVRRHQSRMWLAAHLILADRDDAMDAVQMALIRAFRSARTWRGEGSVAGWLHRIVYRVACDLRVSRKRLPTPVEMFGEDAKFAELIQPDNTQTTSAERVVQQVVASLPADQRECFVRVDLLGFTFAEVAADLGLPEGTVKSRRARGKARLVEALRQAGLVGPTRGKPTPDAKASDEAGP